jgi:hypothetical protein
MWVMPTWDYWHRLEYRREIAKGNRVLEYTEYAEDAGWTFRRKGLTREEWFVYYTRCCAEDFLDRMGARPGTWVVAVYRTGASSEGKGELRGSIRMKRTK